GDQPAGAARGVPGAAEVRAEEGAHLDLGRVPPDGGARGAAAVRHGGDRDRARAGGGGAGGAQGVEGRAQGEVCRRRGEGVEGGVFAGQGGGAGERGRDVGEGGSRAVDPREAGVAE